MTLDTQGQELTTLTATLEERVDNLFDALKSEPIPQEAMKLLYAIRQSVGYICAAVDELGEGEE